MPATLTAIQAKSTISKSLIFDILALAFVYFIPALSHLSSIPIYLIEPMRIMLILVIAYTSKHNAFLIALTLPLFSFLVTSHPVLPETLIMTAELMINVGLFYFLSTKLKNYFLAMLISIIVSKVIYFVLKYVLSSYQIVDSGLFSSSFYITAIIMVVLSFHLAVVLRRKEVPTLKFADPTKEEF